MDCAGAAVDLPALAVNIQSCPNLLVLKFSSPHALIILLVRLIFSFLTYSGFLNNGLLLTLVNDNGSWVDCSYRFSIASGSHAEPNQLLSMRYHLSRVGGPAADHIHDRGNARRIL